MEFAEKIESADRAAPCQDRGFSSILDSRDEAAELSKAPTGIEGLDEITRGGLPRDGATLVLGGSGCGKTVLALQTLVNGARLFGEPGVFVAFEENSRQIVENAARFGWDIQGLKKEMLFFVDAQISSKMVHSGELDLGAMFSEIQLKVEGLHAKRLVLDGVDVLFALLNDRVAERRELFRLVAWLQERRGVTLVTAKSANGETMIRNFGFLSFLVDTTILLKHEVDGRISKREIQVVKYRGSGFAENAFPLTIGPAGIEIASPGPGDAVYPVSTERVSTGLGQLDTMLDGGYFRGSSVLLTGSPGTAKSTLAGAFIDAACKRGEHALFMTFDESAGEVQRNLRSIGLVLDDHVVSGLLEIRAGFSQAKSAEDHLLAIRTLLKEIRPRCLVIDPLSALLQSGGHDSATSFAQRLVRLAKMEGITLVSTSLLTGGTSAQAEATDIGISAIADTWIHLSCVARGGERNRALAIIKSRGTGHSNQVRELLLSDTGVKLADVYSAGGDVLMGTARWEREAAADAERQDILDEAAHRRRELDLAQADASARIESIRREVDARRLELARLEKEQEKHSRDATELGEDLQRLRGGNGAPETVTD